MKKIIAIHASKRQANTWKMLTQIRERLSDFDVEVEIISLYDHEYKDCLGCEACILRGACVLIDDTESLMQRLSEADGIILSSPVYMQQISGRLKTFVDRTCKWYHRPALAGKPVLVLATTKGSGLRQTLKYLQSVAVQWGAIPAGTVGRTIRDIGNPIADKELSRFIRMMDRPSSFRPTCGQLLDFETQKSLASYLGGLDAEYWSQKGWNRQPYYIPCRINPIFRFVAFLFGSFLRSVMKVG